MCDATGAADTGGIAAGIATSAAAVFCMGMGPIVPEAGAAGIMRKTAAVHW
jgi:hypothetical protein